MLFMLPSRISEKIEFTDTCWLWIGQINHRHGYGSVWWHGRKHRAHRLIYQLLKGSILDGLQLDHLCRVKVCVNPAHLEPVTAKENLRRAPTTPTTINALRTHCSEGHEFSGDNLFYGVDGSRRCRICARRRNRDYFHALSPAQREERNRYLREMDRARRARRRNGGDGA